MDSAIVITSALNLEEIDWETMTSQDKYEEYMVRNVNEINIKQALPHGDKPPFDPLLTSHLKASK